jgi:ribosomal protein S18 acetylase RimI-like enzyme
VPDGGQVVTSTYLECAAVRTDFQGAVLTEVDPLNDDRPVTLGRYLLEVLLSDIAERERASVVRAVVARENTRSLRLCARIGLTDERDDPDERFVQRLGRIAA